MAMIYRDIINGTRELMSSVMDNRLNNSMKYLTSITLIMAVPTIVSGIMGMNIINLPFANSPYGFAIIIGLIAVICGVMMWILRRNKIL